MMNFIGKKLTVPMLAFACMVVFAANANALRITEEADFMLKEVSRSGESGPPLTDVIRLTTTANQGGLYTNTSGILSATTVEIRTVGAALLNQVVLSDVGGVIVSPLDVPIEHDVVVIFALQGSAPILLVPGDNSETVLLGKAIVLDIGTIFPVDAGSFNPHDPTTWGYAGLDAANVLAIYDLDPEQDAVITGPNGDSKVLPAFGTNQLSFSDANVPLRTLNGETLWDYAGTPPTSDLLGDIPGPLGADATREFQEVMDIQGDPLLGEGLIISNNGEVVDPVALTDVVGGGEETLNTIYSDFLSIGDFSSFSDLGPGFPNLDDYNPTNLPSATGDFYANFDFVARPISTTFIPEPASAMLGLLGLGGLFMRGRRRNRA